MCGMKPKLHMSRLFQRLILELLIWRPRCPGSMLYTPTLAKSSCFIMLEPKTVMVNPSIFKIDFKIKGTGQMSWRFCWIESKLKSIA